MIKSLLDTDFYKLLMMQAVFHQYKNFKVEYSFFCRNKEVNLSHLAPLIKEEIKNVCRLSFSKEEIYYLSSLKKNQVVFQEDFLNYLTNFKLKEKHVKVSVKKGHLHIDIKGPWVETILWEIYLLSITNELYFKNKDNSETLTEGRNRLNEKISLIKESPDNFKFTEFGTRRRFSRAWQEEVVDTLQKEISSSKYIGTSNLYLSKKLNTFPIGTHAHEYFQAHQSIDYFKSQELSLLSWKKEYPDFLIALSDIYGTDAFLTKFSKDLTTSFKGLRHDSGDPLIWTDKVLNHYKSLDIDTKDKVLIFSDGLNILKALEINKYCEQKIDCIFGIGTSLTNDLGIKALNIVIKMTKCNNLPVVKISDEPSKAIGDKRVILNVQKYFKKFICPACNSRLTESLDTLTFMTNELKRIPVYYYTCSNLECSHEFIPHDEITRAENIANPYTDQEVLKKAKEVMGKDAKAWINSKVPSLGNKKPKDILGKDNYLLIQTLFKIEHGVYG